MKNIIYNYFLFVAGTLITGFAMAQPANNSIIAFKEVQHIKSTDNFTAREIKKKELQIAPSKITSLYITNNHSAKKDKYRRKKKISL